MICRACPRECGIDRVSGAGFCRVGEEFRVSRIAPHFWEEPCISGSCGSGAVFFSGCNLACVYCQNYEISRAQKGRVYSKTELICEIEKLLSQGVHNINLVSPSHYALQIATMLREMKLSVPVVYNCSGYESVESLKSLEGLVDVYLTDLKYLQSDIAKRYSKAENYPKIAKNAIYEMYRQVGDTQLNVDEVLQKGVVIRHLILPNNVENTLDVIDWVAENFKNKQVLFSLMAQYTPMPNVPEELSRSVSQEEYERVMNYFEWSGIERGYVQELSSSSADYIPEFY